MMKKNHMLPSLRIDLELSEKINKAIELLNQNPNYFELGLSHFRRMALLNFSDKVLSEGLEINLKKM